MTTTDAPDFLDTKTSDGLRCFWVIEYKMPPLAQSTDPDNQVPDFDLEVLALCDHQPTMAEALKGIPPDEQDRVYSVRVKPMHQSHFGKAYFQQAAFVNLHTGEVGPLAIELRALHTVLV